MINRLLTFSIYNPWLIIGLTFLAGALGFYCLNKLPIDAVPDVTNNQVQVNIVKEGYTPLEMERQLTYPIENALQGIPGLESTRSLTRNGFAQVTAIFEDHVSIYFARQQITERLQEIKDNLPAGVDVKMGPVATGLSEVLMWSVHYQDKRPLNSENIAYLREVQDWIIKPQLKNIPGLAGVDSIGGFEKEIEVLPDLSKLKQLNISLIDLKDAIIRQTDFSGPGYLNKGEEAFLIHTDGRLSSIDELENLILFSDGPHPIKLKDIAKVANGVKPRFGSSSLNGEETVTGTALMLIGANSREVAQAVEDRLKEINKSLPKGIETTILLDRKELIDSTIETVVKNLAEGALLVILVLFLFLRNTRAALIASLIIPLSMLLTGIGMFTGKISGNLMSLGAIDFGLIVDGAVIIVENALRKRALFPNDDPKETLLNACKEMIRPSLFGQAIIMLVYVPILLLSGIEGRMFHPMALTVMFALLSAFVLSISFIPAALSLFIKKVPKGEGKMMDILKDIYSPILNFTLKHSFPTAIASFALLASSIFLFKDLGQEFIPVLDERNLALQAMRIPSTSIDASTAMQREVESALKEFPEVKHVFSKTGTADLASDPMTPNLSDTFVILEKRDKWSYPLLAKEDLIDMFEERLKQIPGNLYEFTQPIELRFNELIAGVKSDLAIKIYGDDFDKLQSGGEKITALLSQMPHAKDIKMGQTEGHPSLNIKWKRDLMARHQVSPQDSLALLEASIKGLKAADLYEGDRRFDIVLKTPIKNLSELKNLSLNGKIAIPINEIADITETLGMNEIKRENGKRYLAVETNIRGTDIGTFMSELKPKLDKLELPEGTWYTLGGQYEHLAKAKEKLILLIPLSFLMILLLLYASTHSLSLSLVIFTGVPFAWIGGVFSLWFTGIPFSISAAVGFIALSGIAVLNGLVLMSSIQHKFTTHCLFPIQEACLERLRPVLMTALVAMLGFIPMAFSTSAGSEVQKPLAIVVIGGLFSSTLLTLFILPALSNLFRSLNTKTA